MFKCFKTDFEEVQKRINRITKKLDKNNLKWTFEVINETIEEVDIIDYRNLDNIPLWQFKPKYFGKRAVEVVNYNFEMESLKLGDFEVIAVIEHNVTESNENVIHVIKEGALVHLKYRTAKSICEHCNSDRVRNKTVLLQDTKGNLKQVGTSCIKEYTGIDGTDIIKAYQDINNICLEDVNMDYERVGSYAKYEKTIDYLVACIQLIKNVGYVKDETKYKAWDISGTDRQDNSYKELAQQVINYFSNKEFKESETFLNNIKIYLSAEYTKINGFVAYSLLVYEKEIEKEQKIKAEQENKKPSEFFGTVGEKIEKELTLKKRITYETNYTYYGGTSYIYIFEDEQGNQYKWNSANYIEKSEGEQLKIKGTIKAQEEYKEEKQTVLTRCKVL